MRMYHIVYDTIDTQAHFNKLTRKSTLRGPDRAMAIVIFVVKLTYGLDGKER